MVKGRKEKQLLRASAATILNFCWTQGRTFCLSFSLFLSLLFLLPLAPSTPAKLPQRSISKLSLFFSLVYVKGRGCFLLFSLFFSPLAFQPNTCHRRRCSKSLPPPPPFLPISPLKTASNWAPPLPFLSAGFLGSFLFLFFVDAFVEYAFPDIKGEGGGGNKNVGKKVEKEEGETKGKKM